jgi:GNAT superfamily N-acetyltransferase
VSDAVPARGLWTRGFGVSLVHADFATLAADDGIRRGLLDGIERGLDDRPVEPMPEGALTFGVRAGGETVGILAALADHAEPHDVAVLALATSPEHRGHALGARALLAGERRWLRDGATRVLVRVPATNGRGLYFMLRSGFTPLPRQREQGATWFARHSERGRPSARP